MPHYRESTDFSRGKLSIHKPTPRYLRLQRVMKGFYKELSMLPLIRGRCDDGPVFVNSIYRSNKAQPLLVDKAEGMPSRPIPQGARTYSR